MESNSFRQYGWASQASLVFTIPPVATETVTIGSVVYEFSAAGAVTVPTNIPVLISAVNLSYTINNLCSAIATSQSGAIPLVAKNLDGLEVIVYAAYGNGGQLRYASNPLATQTIIVGGTTFEFSAAGVVSDPANIPVIIGGSTAATLYNLASAISRVAPSGFIASVTSSTEVSIYRQTKDIEMIHEVHSTLAFSTTSAASLTIRCANINETGEPTTQMVCGTIVGSALNTAGAYHIKMPMTITGFMWAVYTAAGALVEGCTATVTSTSDLLVLTLGAGGTPLGVGEKFCFIAW